TDRCEDSLAPELWTEVDLHQSQLEFSLAPRSGALILSDLEHAFGPGIGAFKRVTLLSPGADDVVRSEALPLVAQSLALRRRFMPLLVDHVEWNDPADRDNTAGPLVLVATAEHLASLLGAEAPAVNGPTLEISHTPVVSDEAGRVVMPSRVQLIVSGRTADEVLEAARVLSIMDDALNPVPAATVVERDQTPTHFSSLARLVLHPERTYRFADLGLPTQSMRGFGAHGLSLDVRLPSDFYTHDSAQVELLLDLSYGAGMGPGSVVNIFLNGDFVHGRLLDESHGTMFRRYRIALPARRFMPGNNRVDFEFMLRPEVIMGECAGLDGRHLVAQVMGSSTIELPNFGRASSQPNLRLFGNTGFPFNSEQGATRLDLFVADQAQVGPALTLVGRIAQAAGVAHDGWRLHSGSLDELSGSARSIVVAPTSALPESLFDGWSVAFGRVTRWPYAAINDTRSATQPPGGGFAAWLVNSLGLRPVPEYGGAFDDMLRGSVSQVSGLGPMGGLSLMRNPLHGASGAVLVVTAEDDARLAARIESLIQPRVWSQLDGGLVLWHDIDTPVVSARVVDRFEIGDGSDWLLLRLWLSNSPWYWLALVVVGALLLVISASWLLRRRRRGFEAQT
ncbi:celB protein, partial [Ectothiorhodospira sp. PHS-1]|uniref:cellulose biosynthesis cyclic di-GMP-binding regulatory protein BcsB n=1 Tax=Ectothiorhodospira sp. PHS-1 TaxID=519989 RepID=UPI00024A8692